MHTMELLESGLEIYPSESRLTYENTHDKPPCVVRQLLLDMHLDIPTLFLDVRQTSFLGMFVVIVDSERPLFVHVCDAKNYC
jgi:hypothetical protein